MLLIFSSMAASMSPTNFSLFLVISSLAIAKLATAGDPDILSDFILPHGVTNPDGRFFTFTGMRSLMTSTAPAPTNFTVTKATKAEFPALDGQGVSYAVLSYARGTTNPPHTHPRAAELLFLTQGNLQVGFVDTANKLYTQTLYAGDLFVFPKGLVHFHYNPDPRKPARAIWAFGSANAGTVKLPVTLFDTGIDDSVLAKSFKTDVATIQTLKTGLKPKAI